MNMAVISKILLTLKRMVNSTLTKSNSLFKSISLLMMMNMGFMLPPRHEAQQGFICMENVDVTMLLNHVFHELCFNSVITYFSDSSLRVISFSL